MGIAQSVKMAIESIASNKMRAFLTTLGIIIGVAAVIALVSVVDSVTNMITNTLKEMGTNSITVIITGEGTIKELDVKDIVKFVEDNPNLYDGIAPNVSGNVTLKYGTKNLDTSLTGSTKEYETVNNIKLQSRKIF